MENSRRVCRPFRYNLEGVRGTYQYIDFLETDGKKVYQLSKNVKEDRKSVV